MPVFTVRTPRRDYPAVVERGAIAGLPDHIPSSVGKVFVVTTADVWELHGNRVATALSGRDHTVLFFPGGENRKRLVEVERLAGQMLDAGADRASIVVTFGGGIVDDLGGFLAASFMRGVPVIQIPTTLLAQVDAGVGGKTGVNLTSGKNLFGAFHQPLAVLTDPDVLVTLPDREFRAGLYEVLKTGVIRSEPLFRLMVDERERILAKEPAVVQELVAQSVEIKAAVVSADEKESDVRRILNYGHTIGHALEAETAYSRLLHGEAVAFGMTAANHLAMLREDIPAEAGRLINATIARYGPIPSLEGIEAASLVARLKSDKKTIKGTIHFVLPTRAGAVKVVSGIPEDTVLQATRKALEDFARQ